MPKYRCNACQGTYNDTLRDGTVYTHTCPPLPPDKKGVQSEREDKRDENIVTLASGRVIGIRSEGAGVTPLDAVRLPEPAWITAMKDRIAAAEQE